MSRGFSKVSPKVWSSPRFLGLGTPEAKLAYLFVVTNEHVNSAGAYRLREGYAIADLNWPLDVYRDNLALLIQADLITYDAAAQEIYVLRWFRHNPAMNDKHAQAVQRYISELDSDEVREKAEGEFLEAEQERWRAKGGQQGHVSAQLADRLRGTGTRWQS
jgi:hypothetical protein